VTYDTIVVGAGVAGMSAALRLAQGGRRVLVVATGVGSVQLSGGTIDVLGYAPRRVKSPARSLRSFVSRRPDHPYARVGLGRVRAALEWFTTHVEDPSYSGTWSRNFMLPTAVGAVKPSALAPESFVGGDLSAGGRFVIVGLPGLKHFYAPYLSANLVRASAAADAAVEARPLELGVNVREADVTPLSYARLFDGPEFRKSVIADLEGRADADEAVGFPAVLGLEDAGTVYSELRDGLGGRVFEIPTVPPSVPGIRLFRRLKGALRASGGRLLVGTAVTGARTTGRRVAALEARGAARPMTLTADSYVLASGGFAAAGLVMDSHWKVREPVFGLTVAGVPSPDRARFDPLVFNEHPIARAGIATDDALRPLNSGGEVERDNVCVAGAMVAGAEPWREKSGDGISVATGYRAAETILEGRV
jgi:glycerol-3-phosphate dehydrogenase subunit B